MPRAATFRRIALKLAHTTEGAHMSHPDFRVAGQIFATLTTDETQGMVRLTPQQQADFIRQAPQAFTPASGAWGRSGCTMVQLAAIDEDTLGAALTCAWQERSAKPAAKARSAGKAIKPKARA